MGRDRTRQGPLEPPQHLGEQAAAKWAEVYPRLFSRAQDMTGAPPTAAERDACAAYCLAYQHHIDAERQVAALGLVVKSPAGFAVDNPYLGVSRKAQAEMRHWAKALCLLD